MTNEQIINLINTNLTILAKTWVEGVKASEYMDSYKAYSDEELIKRGEGVLNQFTAWISSGASNDEAERYFQKLGETRLREGFSLTEVLYALYLTKRTFYNYISDNQDLMRDLSPKEIFELITLTSNYFDLGNFYTARGYNNEMLKRLEETQKLTKEEIRHILKRSTFDKDDFDAEEVIWRHV